MATCVYCGGGAGIFKIVCERCRVLPEPEEFCAREQELIRRALVRNAPWSVGILVVSMGMLQDLWPMSQGVERGRARRRSATAAG